MDEVTVDQLSGRSNRRQRSCPATSCGICFLFKYMIVITISSVAFAYFTIAVQEKDKCFFAKGNDSGLDSCSVCGDFFICGVSGMIILQVVLVVIAICNTLWGKWLICLKIYELMVLIVSIFLSLAVATVVSLVNKLCGKLNFSDDYMPLLTEVSFWLVSGLLIIAFLGNLFVSLCLCRCTTSNKRQRRQDHWFDERALLNNNEGKRYS